MAEPRTPFRRSPLFHRRPLEGEGGALRIAERPFLGKFVLRVDPEAACERLRSALGIGLPLEPLTSVTEHGVTFLWLGPDEWMLVTPEGEGAERAEKIGAALAGVHHQLVEVSDYYTVIEIAGPRARELLMKLTPLDVHARAFRAGMVAGSMFGRAAATIWQSADEAEDGGPAFRLFIRWSMADYLWCLIANAGREWGVPEEVPVKGETLTIA